MPDLAGILERFAKQPFVYWEKLHSDSFGKHVYGNPVELLARWEDEQRQMITPDGRTVLSSGYLLLATKLKSGSLVMLGTLQDFEALPTYPAPPTFGQGGREILRVKSTPDIDATSYVYEVFI